MNFFRYLLRLRRYKRKSVEVAVFRRGLVTFGEYLTGKGASSTNYCWCQKTRVIAISCGIKISAVHDLVVSQYTSLTDRRTELRQQYRALHSMHSHSKNGPDKLYCQEQHQYPWSLCTIYCELLCTMVLVYTILLPQCNWYYLKTIHNLTASDHHAFNCYTSTYTYARRLHDTFVTFHSTALLRSP